MKKQLAILLLATQSVFGTTYYVDFDAGDDAADGLSTSAAWKTVPGTHNAAGSALRGTGTWGSFTTSALIPDNTTIKIKSGTTHTSAAGGFIWLNTSSASVWRTGCTNLIIEVDSTWGTGDYAIIDATGMTVGIAAILCQIDGVTIRGKLMIRDCDVGAFQGKEKSGGAALTNIWLSDLVLTNNGISYLSDTAGSGDGHINIKECYNLTISNVVVKGNQQFINGILCGNSSQDVVNGWIVNCTNSNLRGEWGVLPSATDDCGIGFKLLNFNGTCSNSVSFDNLKGWDNGEEAATLSIDCKIVGCYSLRNIWGINMNGRAAAFPGQTITHKLVNNLIVSNLYNGINCYSAPMRAYIVNNTFDYNGFGVITNSGGGDITLYNASTITVNPNDQPDTNEFIFVCLNNAFIRGPTNAAMFLNKYGSGSNWLTCTIDFNSYDQAGSTFANWDAYVGGGTYAYGANGPGHASGNWYSQYYNTTTPPALGTGHYHNDSNSKGKLCDVTTLAPLNTSYVPTNSYAGTNYSGASWFIPAMGFSRSGRARTEYTPGVEDFYPVEIGVTNEAVISVGFGKKGQR